MSALQIPMATDSFGRPLPKEAISIERLMPRTNKKVVLYIEDLNVSIKGKPVVGWNSGTKDKPNWWTGVPGDYLCLADKRWSVSHWAPLPGDQEGYDAIAASQPTAAISTVGGAA